VSYLEPALPFFLFLSLAGLGLAWRQSHSGKRPWLLTAGILGITLLSLNPVAWLLARPLEIRYPQAPMPEGDAEAIVVLAGAVDPPQPLRPYPLLGSDSYVRIRQAVWLFKNWKRLPILASGGGAHGEAYSHAMRQALESDGIPPELIWIENKSRSTYENARYGAQILREHGISRIALVIDARSMVRAEASFRKQGMTVLPAPFRFYNLHLSVEDILPTWRAIQANGETAHEILGLVWYRLRGWI
jgi:uncharacterized SAM-binding protein YcdF (DUF218 family)